jgi:hypothetical protein
MGNPSGAQDFIAFAISGLRALLVVAYLMSFPSEPSWQRQAICLTWPYSLGAPDRSKLRPKMMGK